uniref:E3 ubiquitin-protein ligase MYLIP-like n=2 Tax=Dermatophagoides pteronyssinus TaxID=6956 RepID=A0A6P6Y8M5_DERPT|nr:E3 ubiquitin-protein ligase MYLIP-like [Dermatophagoides pteronyssinus]
MMKCLVFQPNNCAIEVNIRNKAFGQECLNKVCDLIDIIEINFFGLQYYRNGQPYWLILRKRIDQQINARMKMIRLYLKVKFYVLPHHIQQNSTKHQFYLNICQYLETKVLKIDSEKRTKLIALIAQIEFGDLDEESYDLKILYSKWLSILFHSEQTKRLTSNHRSLMNNNNHKYRPYCDTLDIDESNTINIRTKSKTMTAASHDGDKNCDFMQRIVFWHQRYQGYSSHYAKNLFLKEALEINDLGVDYFSVTSNKKNLLVGIGPRGITINHSSNHNNDNIKLITYNKLKEIHHHRSSHLLNYNYIITINYNDETNLITEQKFRIYSEKDYYQFFRLINERRAFYSLPMIDQQTIVSNRFNSNFTFLNDLMQTLSSPTSLLNLTSSSSNKSTTLMNKKASIFDVDKTLKQFYDDVRRYIYHFNRQFDNVMLKNAMLVRQDSLLFHHSNQQQQHYTNSDITDNNKSLCKICLDYQIGIAFIPCGHTSCEQCCLNIKNDTCPFCKCEMKSKQKIFL